MKIRFANLNKKAEGGESQLRDETFGIIVAILCLGVLIYLGFRLTSVVGNSDLSKANVTLTQLSDKINSLESGKAADFLYQNPKNWFLKSYINPVKYPKECGNVKSCLCLCKNIQCDSSLTCKGFDLNVVIGIGISGSAIEINTENAMKITAVEALRIIRQDNEIKISEVKAK